MWSTSVWIITRSRLTPGTDEGSLRSIKFKVDDIVWDPLTLSASNLRRRSTSDNFASSAEGCARRDTNMGQDKKSEYFKELGADTVQGFLIIKTILIRRAT